jgi:hypothetical protein
MGGIHPGPRCVGVSLLRVVEEMFNLFCKHEWKVVTEKTIPSVFEKSGDAFTGAKLTGRRAYDIFTSAYVCVIACPKCGKTKTTIITHPE